MEAKKQGAGEEDLSMEEILQSIRRIIADDGEAKPEGSTGAVEEKPAAASDILELTDMIEDDGSITNLKEAKAAGSTVDVLDNIDAALKPAAPAAAPKPSSPQDDIDALLANAAAAPKPSSPQDDIDALLANAAAAPKPSSPQDDIDALLSKAAEEAAISSLAKLNIPEEKVEQKPTTPSPQFRSGMTVEDMVEELLKPMMKEWLDGNLPIIVERIVEREVLRLTRR